jgi:serine protease Do
MSSAVVSKVVNQLENFGETRRGWLGVRIQDVSGDVADALGLDKAAGALVTDVPAGPAADAGIVSGDVILSFDGTDVTDTRQLVRVVANTEVGKAVRVVVFRDGKTKTLMITLGRREEAEKTVPVSAPATGPVEKDILGMTVTAMSDELRQQLGLDDSASGLVVGAVDETTEAYEKGLRAGDVITEAGQQKVQSVSDFEDQIAAAKDAGRKSLLLLVRRQGEPRFVALSLG